MKEVSRSRIDKTKGQAVSLTTHEGGPVLELNYYESGSRFDAKYDPGEALDHLAFQVEDLNKSLAEAADAGYPMVLEMKTENSRWVYIKDPNGIYIELFE